LTRVARFIGIAVFGFLLVSGVINWVAGSLSGGRYRQCCSVQWLTPVAIIIPAVDQPHQPVVLASPVAAHLALPNPRGLGFCSLHPRKTPTK
jgi:hypothetical protein